MRIKCKLLLKTLANGKDEDAQEQAHPVFGNARWEDSSTSQASTVRPEFESEHNVLLAVAGQPDGHDIDVRQPPPAIIGTRYLRTLLVEDAAGLASRARRLLQKWGHTIRVAATGAAALRAIDEEAFDLICIDVQMPDMSGFEIAASIRARERALGGRIPILAMTYSEEWSAEACLNSGVDLCVSKPIGATEFFSAINQLLGKSAAESHFRTYQREKFIRRSRTTEDLRLRMRMPFLS